MRPGPSKGPMLTAANAAIGVDALRLLRGEIRITNIEAQSPTIRLEQRRDGRASWQFTDGSGAARSRRRQRPPRAAAADHDRAVEVITDATLIYDAEGSDLVSYAGVDLTLDWPERLGPATIAAVLRPTGTEVAVDATIDAFASFITGDVRPVTLQIDTGGGRIDFDGRASTAGAVAGALRVKTADTDAFMRNLGMPGAAVAPRAGAQHGCRL